MSEFGATLVNSYPLLTIVQITAVKHDSISRVCGRRLISLCADCMLEEIGSIVTPLYGCLPVSHNRRHFRRGEVPIIH